MINRCHDGPMSVEDPARELRRELVEIDDAVRALPSDDFAGIHALRSKADKLREHLAQIVETEQSTTLARWADRAGRKGTHSVDDDVEQAKAAIVSPGEGGAAT